MNCRRGKRKFLKSYQKRPHCFIHDSEIDYRHYKIAGKMTVPTCEVDLQNPKLNLAGIFRPQLNRNKKQQT